MSGADDRDKPARRQQVIAPDVHPGADEALNGGDVIEAGLVGKCEHGGWAALPAQSLGDRIRFREELRGGALQQRAIQCRNHLLLALLLLAGREIGCGPLDAAAACDILVSKQNLARCHPSLQHHFPRLIFIAKHASHALKASNFLTK